MLFEKKMRPGNRFQDALFIVLWSVTGYFTRMPNFWMSLDTTSVFSCFCSCFFSTVQSYGDFLPIPRKNADSSHTCVDKHPIFGHIEEIGPKVVQTTPSMAPHSGGTNTEKRRFWMNPIKKLGFLLEIWEKWFIFALETNRQDLLGGR